MKFKDRVYLLNLADAASLAADGLLTFRSYMIAWANHPLTGKLPPDTVDAVLDDLKQHGLENWPPEKTRKNLYRIVTGQEHTR